MYSNCSVEGRTQSVSSAVKMMSLENINKMLRATPSRAVHDRVAEMSDARKESKRKSDRVEQMNEERIEKRREWESSVRSKRQRKQNPYISVKPPRRKGGDANRDARKYREDFDNRTKFYACGVCGVDEGLENLKELSDMVRKIVRSSDLPVLYEHVIDALRSAGAVYDGYIQSIKAEFHPTGLLKCAEHICNSCLVVLKRGHYVEKAASSKKSTNQLDDYVCDDDEEEMEETDEDDNESQDDIRISHHALKLNVPMTAYLRGLYPGIVPNELQGLRTVELSMISLYNSITRLRLNSKGMSYKYFHGYASTYTIVNDITTVASCLPQLPTIHSFAILKYSNDVCDKELKYRPGVVKRALTWLKANNHLYKDVPMVYPNEWNVLSEDAELEPQTMVISEMEEEALRDEAKQCGTYVFLIFLIFIFVLFIIFFVQMG